MTRKIQRLKEKETKRLRDDRLRMKRLAELVQIDLYQKQSERFKYIPVIAIVGIFILNSLNTLIKNSLYHYLIVLLIILILSSSISFSLYPIIKRRQIANRLLKKEEPKHDKS